MNEDISIEATKVKPGNAKKKIIAAITGSVLLIGISVLGTLFATGQFDESDINSEVENNSLAPEIIVTDESEKDQDASDDDIETAATWQIPALAPLPELFVDIDAYYSDIYGEVSASSYVQFFKLGELGDGREVFALEVPVFGLGQSQHFGVMIKDGVSYTIIAHKTNLPFFSYDEDRNISGYTGPDLAQNVTVDFDQKIEGLVFESEFFYNGQNFIASYGRGLQKTVDPQPEVQLDTEVVKLGTAGGGTLYEIRTLPQTKDDARYAISRFTLKLPSGFTQDYAITGELTREKIDPIIWPDGSENADDYLSAGRGCSVFSGGSEVAIDIGLDELKQIGTSKGGQTIYGFKDVNDPLHVLHYDEYERGKEFVEGDSDLTIEQFDQVRAVYLVEDGLGRLLVFSNQKYVPAYGCAKPVVYLYPEQTVTVDVAVGAEVTISEPQYEKDGWQSVTAQPNGDLEYRGQSYDSLFWEGFGEGEYPEIDKGFIVHTFDAVNVWEDHLQLLGMNEKEIADFTEFWSEKLPSTPYVRISWLGTQDLEQLAPLKISQPVDTLIRVFMDMEGLEEPIDIEPQRLGSIERNGFTVTEWGGLARDGSVPRLQ